MADINNLEELKANAKVMAAALEHAKKSHTSESLMFYFDKGNPEAVYRKFLDPKGPSTVNVDSEMTAAAKKLADAKDWGNSAWPKLIAKAKKEVGSLYWTDVWPRFQKTPEYAAATKKVGDPAKAASLLGIKDVAALKKAMNEPDATKAEKLFADLAKKEELKQKAKDMIAALEKSGLM